MARKLMIALATPIALAAALCAATAFVAFAHRDGGPPPPCRLVWQQQWAFHACTRALQRCPSGGRIAPPSLSEPCIDDFTRQKRQAA